MKAPFVMHVKTNNQGTYYCALEGADADSISFEVVLPREANAYQALHAVKEMFADAVAEVLARNGVFPHAAEPEHAPATDPAPAEPTLLGATDAATLEPPPSKP